MELNLSLLRLTPVSVILSFLDQNRLALGKGRPDCILPLFVSFANLFLGAFVLLDHAHVTSKL